MNIRWSKLYICILLACLTGCATTNQPKIIHMTRVHQAPSESVIVATVKAMADPVSEGFKAAAQIGSPVSAGFGNLLSALGSGIGSAISLGTSANSATTLTTVTGISDVRLDKCKSTIEDPTNDIKMASEADTVTTGAFIDKENQIE